jgi:hypothetical protein
LIAFSVPKFSDILGLAAVGGIVFIVLRVIRMRDIVEKKRELIKGAMKIG